MKWIVAGAGIVVVLAVTAGCKSSSASTATGTTPAPVPATSSPAASTPPAAAGGTLSGLPSACPSAAEVMSNLGLSSLVVSGADPSICQYLHNGDKTQPYAAITFNAVPSSFTPAMVKAGLTQGQKSVKDVSGLGDAAFSFVPHEGPGAGLTFLSGTVICSIVTTVPVTTDGEIALAKAVLAG